MTTVSQANAPAGIRHQSVDLRPWGLPTSVLHPPSNPARLIDACGELPRFAVSEWSRVAADEAERLYAAACTLVDAVQQDHGCEDPSLTNELRTLVGRLGQLGVRTECVGFTDDESFVWEAQQTSGALQLVRRIRTRPAWQSQTMGNHRAQVDLDDELWQITRQAVQLRHAVQAAGPEVTLEPGAQSGTEMELQRRACALFGRVGFLARLDGHLHDLELAWADPEQIRTALALAALDKDMAVLRSPRASLT